MHYFLHFLTYMIDRLHSYEFYKGFKGLKVTTEWQDNGTGVLHQVAQHPIDRYIDIQGAHEKPRGTWYWLQNR